MPSRTTESPLVRAIRETSRQADRTRRAEAARLRQRALLLDLMVGAMRDLHIPLSEVREAQRNLVQGTRQSGHCPPNAGPDMGRTR